MKFLPLLFRNLTRRHPIRTVFTFLSILVAFILFGLLMAVKQGFEAGIDIAGQQRLMTIHKVSLIQLLPQKYRAEIARLPGVAGVTHAIWFGGIYKDKRNRIEPMAVEPESWLDAYPEYVLGEEERERFLATRTGLLAGRQVAESYGWAVGDRIPIQATIWRPNDGGSDTYEFDLVAIYDGDSKEVGLTGLFFHHDYLMQRMGDVGQVGWYVVTVEDPGTADDVANAIDAVFANSSAETKTTTEKAFMQSFAKQIGDTGAMMVGITGIVFFVILLIAGNTMAQSVRERIHELGVLKTLGVTDLGILLLVLTESVLLTSLAGGLGLGLIYLAVPYLHPAVEAFLPIFYVPHGALLAGVGLAVGLGLATGAIPAVNAMRLPIVTALRRV